MTVTDQIRSKIYAALKAQHYYTLLMLGVDEAAELWNESDSYSPLRSPVPRFMGIRVIITRKPGIALQ